MADEDKDEVARALERLSTGKAGAPTPQPKPRPTPQPKSRQSVPAVRPPAPASPPPRATKPAQSGLGSDDLASLTAKSLLTVKRQKNRSSSISAGIGLRRTLIPILLTGGVILVALATIHFIWDSIDNPTIDLPRSVVGGMYLLALICWGLAAGNMAAVRRQIRNSKEQSPS